MKPSAASAFIAPLLAILLASSSAALFGSGAHGAPVGAFALSPTAPEAIPRNAHARPYGSGWQCDYGFREASAGCLVIEAPANAYISDLSIRTGWECERGYREFDGGCLKIVVPANSHAIDSSYGRRGWDCDRGYQADGEICSAIGVPKNGYLADSAYGRGWHRWRSAPPCARPPA